MGDKELTTLKFKHLNRKPFQITLNTFNGRATLSVIDSNQNVVPNKIQFHEDETQSVIIENSGQSAWQYITVEAQGFFHGSLLVAGTDLPVLLPEAIN